MLLTEIISGDANTAAAVDLEESAVCKYVGTLCQMIAINNNKKTVMSEDNYTETVQVCVCLWVHICIHVCVSVHL